MCKAAIEAANGDVEAAKATLLAEKGAEWEAEEAAKAAALQEATAKSMALKEEPAPEPVAEEAAPEPVAEEAAPEPVAEEAAPEITGVVVSTTLVKPEVLVAKAGLTS